MRNLEKEMEELETEKASLTEKIGAQNDFQKTQQYSVRIVDITKLLEQKFERWLELAGKVA
jgi:hypothetical protein